jgi:hypothetical protein
LLLGLHALALLRIDAGDFAGPGRRAPLAPGQPERRGCGEGSRANPDGSTIEAHYAASPWPTPSPGGAARMTSGLIYVDAG